MRKRNVNTNAQLLLRRLSSRPSRESNINFRKQPTRLFLRAMQRNQHAEPVVDTWLSSLALYGRSSTAHDGIFQSDAVPLLSRSHILASVLVERVIDDQLDESD